MLELAGNNLDDLSSIGRITLIPSLKAKAHAILIKKERNHVPPIER